MTQNMLGKRLMGRVVSSFPLWTVSGATGNYYFNGRCSQVGNALRASTVFGNVKN